MRTAHITRAGEVWIKFELSQKSTSEAARSRSIRGEEVSNHFVRRGPERLSCLSLRTFVQSFSKLEVDVCNPRSFQWCCQSQKYRERLLNVGWDKPWERRASLFALLQTWTWLPSLPLLFSFESSPRLLLQKPVQDAWGEYQRRRSMQFWKKLWKHREVENGMLVTSDTSMTRLWLGSGRLLRDFVCGATFYRSPWKLGQWADFPPMYRPTMRIFGIVQLQRSISFPIVEFSLPYLLCRGGSERRKLWHATPLQLTWLSFTFACFGGRTNVALRRRVARSRMCGLSKRMTVCHAFSWQNYVALPGKKSTSRSMHRRWQHAVFSLFICSLVLEPSLWHRWLESISNLVSMCLARTT